jgi:ribosomal protein S18 acetylase RimI-like enzyme
VSYIVEELQKKGSEMMIEIKQADVNHINGIIQVCSEGYRDTYKDTHTKEYIERIIGDFYNNERVEEEVLHISDGWNGYFVAIDDGVVVGAIGGGLIDKDQSEVFVLYLDPHRRGEGIGTKLLQALTEIQQKKGSRKQWVSVAKGNEKGIPFYEARNFQLVNEQTSYGNTDDEEYVSLRYCREI